MTSFSRNFIIHALPFLAKFDKESTPEVCAVLATSSSFINGSLAPEMMMKLSPRFDDEIYSPPFVVEILREFSSTLQFVTHLSFHQNQKPDSGRVFLPLFFNELIHKSRYFSRQLTHLDIFQTSYAELFPHLSHLRALRSLKLLFELSPFGESQFPQSESELVTVLQHLDLDELCLNLRFWEVLTISPDILHQVWTKNPMRRLRRLHLRARANSACSISLKCISDFHPSLSRLVLDITGKSDDLPDLSVMNDLCELEIGALAFDQTTLDIVSTLVPQSSAEETTTTYCNSLTHLTLWYPQMNDASVFFLIKHLGSSDVVRHFRMKTRSQSNHNTAADRSLSLQRTEYRDDFLELLISRYPLLEQMNVSDNSRVTDRQFQLIAKNMECLKVLLLPAVLEEMEESPLTAESMSWIFDPSKKRFDDGFDIAMSLEALSLPAISFGRNDPDLTTVFGSSSSSVLEDRRWCLKKLIAGFSLFASVRSFFSFIKHFAATLELVNLPLMGNVACAENNNVDDLQVMQNLSVIVMDWHHVEKYSQYHAIGPLIKAAPNLRHFSILKLRQDSIFEIFAAGGLFGMPREEPKECEHVTEIFEAVAGNLVQDVERRFLNIQLDKVVAELTPENAWAAMAKIPSLRRVEVTEGDRLILPKSDVLFYDRYDVETNLGFKADDDDYYDDEDYYEEENDEQQEVKTSEEKQKEEKTTINAPPTVVPEKKKVVATKKPATKKLATKKPVAKKTAKKSTKKTAAAGKKKKVAPKKATKAKKPVSKKTISTKKKPTAKKAPKKKKPVAKKSTTGKNKKK